ncbi:MAG: DUF2911 domain-containing protein [Ginsengibacter sp.]|jgi:hypothetical protein
MKKILSFALLSGIFAMQAFAQKPAEDKTKRPSPPATVTQKITSGATITINYSQPSVKGRTIGKDLDPMAGKVWRTGANEATTFETNKDVMINGVSLPAGKYGLFTIWNGNDVTVIFNKTWEQWGAFKYKEEDDQLRFKATAMDAKSSTEKMTFSISPEGEVSLLWGPKKVSFMVK